jgi:hypothetical protein
MSWAIDRCRWLCIEPHVGRWSRAACSVCEEPMAIEWEPDLEVQLAAANFSPITAPTAIKASLTLILLRNKKNRA